jgi:MOSC domain-containing protein YiiM
MLKHDQTLSDLRSVNASTGRLCWIGLRPAHHQAMIMPNIATLLENKGFEGDHIAQYASKKRQISLIQAEHLAVIAKLMNTDTISAETLRRNLVIEGINLLGLKGQRFSIGDCTRQASIEKNTLEGTGPCHPCSRMEENLGSGGYNAMRGHGGITAKVIKGGTITIGNLVVLLPNNQN